MLVEAGLGARLRGGGGAARGVVSRLEGRNVGAGAGRDSSVGANGKGPTVFVGVKRDGVW